MKQFDPNNINGVIPAMITSFNKDESINKEGIRKTVNYLISAKVDGLYITGSTGETFLMSQEEKKQAIEIIVEEVNGRVPVIAHIGSIGTKITTELGQYAEKIGVDALSALPPFYYGFSNDEIFNYYQDISNSTNLPITVYNISHAHLMDLDMLKRLASIKNVKGVKYTAPTHFNFSKIKKEIGNSFKIYSGMDEMSLSGLISGADGIIGSFYNLMPELFVDIYAKIKEENINEAKKIQEKINVIIMYALSKSGYPFIKMGLNWLDVDSGYVRKPFTTFVDKEIEHIIKKDLKKLADQNDLSGIKFLEKL
jgi:N-acetylneuraminate lyase